MSHAKGWYRQITEDITEHRDQLLEALQSILATGTREHWTDEGNLEKRYSPEAQIAKEILEGK